MAANSAVAWYRTASLSYRVTTARWRSGPLVKRLPVCLTNTAIRSSANGDHIGQPGDEGQQSEEVRGAAQRGGQGSSGDGRERGRRGGRGHEEPRQPTVLARHLGGTQRQERNARPGRSGTAAAARLGLLRRSRGRGTDLYEFRSRRGAAASDVGLLLGGRFVE